MSHEEAQVTLRELVELRLNFLQAQLDDVKRLQWWTLGVVLAIFTSGIVGAVVGAVK